MAFRELHPAFELLDLVQSPSTILIRLLIESVKLGDPAEALRPIAIGLHEKGVELADSSEPLHAVAIGITISRFERFDLTLSLLIERQQGREDLRRAGTGASAWNVRFGNTAELAAAGNEHHVAIENRLFHQHGAQTDALQQLPSRGL